MPISAKPAAAKATEPVLPTQLLLKYDNKPNTAKLKTKKPLVYRPKLKSGPVAPGTMPRSLKALSVQLKGGYDQMANNIQANASIGAAIPEAAPILSRLLVFPDNLFTSNTNIP